MRLHSRIYVHSLVVLVVVACLTTAGVFAVSVHGIFMGQIQERVARHLASLAADDFRDSARLQGRVQRMHDDLDLDVTVRDTTGRVLAQSGEALAALSPSVLAALGRDAVIVHRGLGWYVVAAVSDPGSGTILGSLQASPRRRFAGIPSWRPVLVVVFVLVVVALVTIPTARRITRPLRRLTEAAKRFGDGDLTARAPLRAALRGRRGDEVQELTAAFNDMAGRVEEVVRSQRELIANVSHELRSPLARIRMAMNLLPEEAASAARLRGVEADLTDLDRLIEDVLTAARLEETRLPTRLDKVDARKLLVEVAERARQDPVIDGRLVQVAEGVAAPLCADEALLRRALWNLVENAAKYGAPPITLAARPSGDGVVLSVSDLGPGIPAAERERVFVPFYRADRARTQNERHGVGLGLTLARRIAEVHGGTIRVESGDGERGCRVVITLPARPPA